MLAFLLNYQVEPKMNKPYTHSSYNGKLWNIPDDKLNEFYNLYMKHITDELNSNDEYPSIVEYHTNKTCSPITIDIDIKQTMKNRQLDNVLLKEIYDEFKGYLDEIFKNDIDYTCYMLMRNKPYLDQKSGLFKDGIHIYFPYIVTSFDFQFKLRQQMMPILKDIMKNIENKNSIEDTYDEAVIKKNGMFLFMSTKPKTKPYKIYKIYNMDDELINDDIRSILDILSLRNKTTMTEYKNEKIKEEYEMATNISQKKIPNNIKNYSDDEIDTELNKYLCNVSEQEMSEYIDMLPDVYCDDYHKWLVIGAILHNTNPDFKEIFRDFSQKSDKYNTNDFEKMWDSYLKFNGEKVTFASLVNIFKQNDLMDEYNNIKNRYKEKNENNIRENRFKECIKSNKKHFDKNSPLSIKNMYVNSKMLCGATLSDRHCPCIKGKHDKSYTTMNLINSGMLYQYCGLCEKMFPSEGVKIELSVINNIFGNTINITNNYNNNKDEEICMDDILKDHKIFDDDDLNKLMINSLTESHKDIADVIYYLNRDKFNVTQNNVWYYYEKHKWNKHKEDKLKRIIMEDIPKYYKKIIEYVKNELGNMELIKKIDKIIKNIKSMALEENLMKCLKIIYYTENDTFENNLDTNPNLIGFTNGVYDLEKMEFRCGKPEDYISMSVQYEYEEGIEYDGLNKMLEEILPIKNVKHYVLKLLGYCLYGKNEIQKFFCWSGIGSNGKSILLELIEKTFGDYYTTIDISIITQKRSHGNNANPELAKTINKRIVTMSEPDVDDKLNIGLMKSLSGCDKMAPRGVYAKEGKSFVPIYKMILICNDLPKIKSNEKNSHSIWRRIRNIRFISTFMEEPNENKKYEYKLNETLNENFDKWKVGFINILIKYYGIYKNEKLKDIPEIMESTNEYKEENDPIIEFKNEHIEFTDNEYDGVQWTTLKEEYEKWYRRIYKNEIKDFKKLKEQIEEKIFDGTKEKPVDIKIKNEGKDKRKKIRGWIKYKIVNVNNYEEYNSDDTN